MADLVRKQVNSCYSLSHAAPVSFTDSTSASASLSSNNTPARDVEVQVSSSAQKIASKIAHS